MSTKTIDPTTDAYADYVAVVANDVRPSDRAKERGIAPATVSANVKRIKDALANGATLPDGADVPTHTDAPTFYQWVRDTHGEDVAELVAMFDSSQESLNNDRAKVQRIIDTATDRLAAIDSRLAARETMLTKALPKGTPTFAAMRDAFDATRDGDTE